MYQLAVWQGPDSAPQKANITVKYHHPSILHGLNATSLHFQIRTITIIICMHSPLFVMSVNKSHGTIGLAMVNYKFISDNHEIEKGE